MTDSIIFEREGFYRIIALKEFRRTPGVEFHILGKKGLPPVDALDRVVHEKDAVSPGPVGNNDRPWYMHTHQDDNLIVMSGIRNVELFDPVSGDLLHFTVSPHEIIQGQTVLYKGPAILSWYKGIFHRIISGKSGSASLNIASHYPGFNIDTNFNIYSLNTESAEYHVLRKGFLDSESINYKTAIN